MQRYLQSDHSKELINEKNKVGLVGSGDLFSHLITSSSSSSKTTIDQSSTIESSSSSSSSSQSWNQYKKLTVDATISNNRRLQKTATELKGWSIKNGIKTYTTFRNGNLVSGQGPEAIKLALGDGALGKKNKTSNDNNNNNITNENEDITIGKKRSSDNNKRTSDNNNNNNNNKQDIINKKTKKIHSFFNSI